MTPWPSSARILGMTGLIAATLSLVGGFAHETSLIGIAGAVMVLGNAYALVRA